MNNTRRNSIYCIRKVAERCQFPNMNYQLAPYQPLISRRIEFAPQQLPAAPMVSRRMEFGMRKLKNRLREKTPVLSESEFLPLRSLPPTRSRSQTPAEVLSSISRFAARPPVNTKYRNKTPPTTRFRVIAKPSKPNGIRFNLQEDSDEDVQVDDSQNGIDYEGEGDSGNKISKPLGEPGRPKSGGYKLESVLGWNEATFEAVRVSLGLEKGFSFTIT
jgi:hypothetical protein